MILHDQHGAWSAMIWVDQVSADSSYPSHPSHPSQTSWMLVGGWPTPLKNMSSSVGIIIPNIWKKKCSKPPTRMSVSGFKFSWLFSPQLSDLGFSGGRPHLPSCPLGRARAGQLRWPSYWATRFLLKRSKSDPNKSDPGDFGDFHAKRR